MYHHDYEAVPLGELRTLEVGNVLFVQVEGQQPDVPYPITLTHLFSFDEHTIPRISIRTAQRRDFLATTTEEAARCHLDELTRNIHEITGGVVDMSETCEVVREFNETGDMDDMLVTVLSLVPNGDVFSDTLSAEAAELPLSVTPGPQAARYYAYRRLAHRVNPNQIAKDEATKYGIGKRWQEWFERYNPAEIITREPMIQNLGSVALLMEALRDQGIFESTTASVRVEI